MSRERPEVVIVGGGFAGLYAARALRGTAAHVTIVDRRNHHLFQPLLYQVATAALNPADIAAPIRSVFRGARNVSVVLADTEDTWNGLFTALGRDYQEPRLVLFSGATQSACGVGQSAMGRPNSRSANARSRTSRDNADVDSVGKTM